MLDNDILHRVGRPGRYTGGEWNSTVKDWDETAVRMALAYPDVYEIGMSNLAIPIFYELLNRLPDVLAERVYTPWVDMEAAMRERGISLFSLESPRPLGEFDIIGFSLDYQLAYTNVLTMLDLARLPLRAADRDDAQPLVIAGGSCCLNPEPLADFIDVFFLGDGEESVPEFLDAYRAWRGQGRHREDLLHRLAAIPGVYVPSLYTVSYYDDGTVKSVNPNTPEASPVVRRRIVDKLPPPPLSPVVPYLEVVHDRGAIEIQRGCSRGCRFCQAGMIYRPVRERPTDEVIASVGEIVANCGYDEVSLVSLNTSDYTGIEGLVRELSRRYPRLALSLPSLRLDKSSISLVGSLPTRSRTGLTFAPEAGSERLRRVINKNITEESLLDTAAAAFERGWSSLKLYFMVGLPTETLEDVEGIVRLVENVRARGKQASGKKPMIRISASTFVPKPHTPFQWSAQNDDNSLKAKHEILQQGLRQKGTKLSWQDTRTSLLEACLSRGDRRLGEVIRRAWELGCRFDAWSEHFNFDNWLQAFDEAGIKPAFYAHRERPLDEVLPWSHIDAGVSVDFLKQEYRRSLEGELTPDCRTSPCNACGLQDLPNCRQKSGAA